MDAEFWHSKWQQSEQGFHLNEVNPLLKKHFNHLSVDEGERVFLPLCGKTLDIGWLLERGCRVVGCELSQVAIDQLFEQLDLVPTIFELGPLKHYCAQNLDVFVGDIFELSKEVIGPIDLVYDRAALVALPDAMRKQYSAHLVNLTECARQLLICFEYDQALIDGPPFSIVEVAVQQYYGDHYRVQMLERVELSEPFKSVDKVAETVWLLDQ